MRTASAYAEAVFNERPLHVMVDSDPDYVPITPNLLVFGRNLRLLGHDMLEINLKDPDFKLNNKNLNIMALKLRDTLSSIRKHWKNDYFQFLTLKDSLRNKSCMNSKSLISPKVNHYVLIKDSELRIGKIIELLPSSDGEIRQVMVRTPNSTSVFPVFKLRYLEGYSDEEACSPTPRASSEGVRLRTRIPRLAKDQASDKIRDLAQINNAFLGSLFLSSPSDGPGLGEYPSRSLSPLGY